MKKIILLLTLPFLFVGCKKEGGKIITKSDLKTQKDSISYALAYDVASRLKAMDINELNLDAVNTAFSQVYGIGDSTPLLDKNTVDAYLESFFMQKQMEKAEAFKKDGDAFLNDNKGRPGVNTLQSGLQYKVLKEGKGEKIGNKTKVVVNYTGRLMNGQTFDSTEGGEPAEIDVNEVIPGWTEILKLMPIGSTWEIYIPADLAYGSGRGPGNRLPPYSVLIFSIELISAK